ncbi:O-antigen ligase family protein [Stappia taiwanensis]|uniref:O-antigen ligase family protein n=1 Tax=Stappia taiwanensis TaxID=992267 RepID=A0A838XN89_9HYPH|nr:O-antigen ligase family protein [Stappia taiwanensis]MBA4610228.1 O-antigen ligase family protein [Stappia taiwanensis]
MPAPLWLCPPRSRAAGRGWSVPAETIAAAALWCLVFLGGFVFREPAPYELAMLVVLAGWLIAGARFPAAVGPLLLIMVLFVTGGLFSSLMSDDFGEAALYITVTAFLALTAIFFACIVAVRPERLSIIANAYIASAVIVTLTGIAGYFHLLSGDSFTLYGRAKGTFQDPNVYGPFLVLPWALLLHQVLTRPVTRALPQIALLLFLTIGVFLSFSRAAWGLLAFAGIGVYLAVFITMPRGPDRLRLIAYAIAGLGGFVLLMGIALSIDSVADMFLQRAKLVQDYDTARLGRFARYSLGFQMVLDHPFGLGPLQFRNFFPEDEHNSYLKAFTTYGWLGGFAYLLLVTVTVRQLFPLMFQPRPWQPFAQCVFMVLLGHMLMSAIIDTDRWRHLYLLYGLAWGLIGAEQAYRHARQGALQPLRCAQSLAPRRNRLRSPDQTARKDPFAHGQTGSSAAW